MISATGPIGHCPLLVRAQGRLPHRQQVQQYLPHDLLLQGELGLKDANKPSKRFSQGHYPVVEYLLNTGADPNAKVTSKESFSLSMDSPLQIMYNCMNIYSQDNVISKFFLT